MITYPVDTSKTFTFKLGGEVKRRRPWPREDGGPIESPHPDLVVLEEVTAPLPAFDSATQKLGPGEWEDDHVNQTATFVRPVVDLTAEELAERAADAERQAKRTEVANAVAGLRSWADDAAGVTVTTQNHVVVTQTTVNRFGILCDRLADLIEGHFGQ